MFRVISLAAIHILVFLLIFNKYKIAKEGNGKYLSSLKKRILRWFSGTWKEQFRKLYQRRFVRPYPGNQKWIFVSLAVSFLGLNISGFFFALFMPHRINGIPLVLHVLAGGLFGLSLAVGVLLRSQYHHQEKDKTGKISILGLEADWPRIFFWVFVMAGFILCISALAMMLPYFSLKAQIKIFSLHRYSALLAVLATIAFLFLTQENEDA